jgi:hypothetical protein
MKAAFFYILLLCFGLLGAHNYAHATAHNGKVSFAATHNTVHKQQIEANTFIDVEDENDDKDITRKLPQHANWILTTVVQGVFSDVRNLAANNSSDNSLPDLTGAQICIEHRVLRI